MKNNFERLVGKLDNEMINIHIRGYETSDIPDEKKREIYKYYLGKEFPEFAEEIYNLTEASFIEEEKEMNAEKWLAENMEIVIRGIEATKIHKNNEAWLSMVNKEIDGEEFERRCRLGRKEEDIKLKEVQQLLNQ